MKTAIDADGNICSADDFERSIERFLGNRCIIEYDYAIADGIPALAWVQWPTPRAHRVEQAYLLYDQDVYRRARASVAAGDPILSEHFTGDEDEPDWEIEVGILLTSRNQIVWNGRTPYGVLHDIESWQKIKIVETTTLDGAFLPLSDYYENLPGGSVAARHENLPAGSVRREYLLPIIPVPLHLIVDESSRDTVYTTQGSVASKWPVILDATAGFFPQNSSRPPWRLDGSVPV